MLVVAMPARAGCASRLARAGRGREGVPWARGEGPGLRPVAHAPCRAPDTACGVVACARVRVTDPAPGGLGPGPSPRAQEVPMRRYRTVTPHPTAASPLLVERAAQMRAAPTSSEARLFEALRGRRLGVAFRRQVPLLGRFIVDLLAHPSGGSSSRSTGRITPRARRPTHGGTGPWPGRGTGCCRSTPSSSCATCQRRLRGCAIPSSTWRATVRKPGLAFTPSWFSRIEKDGRGCSMCLVAEGR